MEATVPILKAIIYEVPLWKGATERRLVWLGA